MSVTWSHIYLGPYDDVRIKISNININITLYFVLFYAWEETNANVTPGSFNLTNLSLFFFFPPPSLPWIVAIKQTTRFNPLYWRHTCHRRCKERSPRVDECEECEEWRPLALPPLRAPARCLEKAHKEEATRSRGEMSSFTVSLSLFGRNRGFSGRFLISCGLAGRSWEVAQSHRGPIALRRVQLNSGIHFKTKVAYESLRKKNEREKKTKVWSPVDFDEVTHFYIHFLCLLLFCIVYCLWVHPLHQYADMWPPAGMPVITQPALLLLFFFFFFL